ncbi:MAG: RlmE family RNA methyltransferase [OM182 bacterium]|nr:MAG: RlmE family RNA methyltransferase [OM182 bacterium]HBK19100.1 23S rRNA methyltransferase [Gammaproteobacteria bacterium]|tara:strand:+ start:13577 stop:14218 length:642 start_codon:yes stop_codon:yes gene_type:complete
MVKRSKSSDRWLQRQRKDYFVRQAQEGGHVSRAHFKLEQLDQRFKLVRSRSRILELGAAPGGWTHYLEQRASQGLLIAVDPLPITSAEATHAISGLAGEAEVDDAIDRILDNRSLDLVLSDMAPNISGVRTVDQARAMDLADIALHGASKWLRRGGSMAIKAFQGEGLEAWLKARKTEFERVQMTKPKASRPESREVFIVALGFKGVEAPEIE